MNWIKVSERLPAHEDMVLVLDNKGFYALAIFYDAIDSSKKLIPCWLIAYNSNDTVDNITHWMPLPEKPND